MNSMVNPMPNTSKLQLRIQNVLKILYFTTINEKPFHDRRELKACLLFESMEMTQ